MQKYFFTFLSVCLFTQLHAQKFELTVDAYSGLFHYGGKSTAGVSYINEGNPDYTSNPYGNKNGFSYGGGFGLQYVAKSGFIAGTNVDYEILRSKVNINGYLPFYFYLFYGPANYNPTPSHGDGETFLQSQNINFSPYIGYRITTNKVKVDLMPGIDFGLNVSSYDKGKVAVDGGGTFSTDRKIDGTPTDLRLRVGIAAIYNRFGVTASYAYGLINIYPKTINDGSYNAHSELIRFGLSYRIF